MSTHRLRLAPSAATAISRNPTLPNFDRIARVYRWAEYLALGVLLQRTRTHFLPQLTPARHALVLGDGDGRFTAALLRHCPQTRVHAVDLSASMLHLLCARAARAGTAGRLSTEQNSALCAAIPPHTDLIATHFFLDCLDQTEVDTLAARLARNVAPGCLWVVSDFGLPQSRLLRPLAAAYIRLLYLAFRILTGLRPQRLPCPQRALSAAGFVLLHRAERLKGLLYSELWQLPNPAAGAISGPAVTSTCT